jgi:hypothetical protein
MEGLNPLALVMGASRRLAVNGDRIVLVGPWRPDPAVQATPGQRWIKAIDQRPQRAGAWHPAMKGREPPQKIQMFLASCSDIVKIVV